MTQLKMFETADLPLFSGTAPRGKIETFDPKPAHRQDSLINGDTFLPCGCCFNSLGTLVCECSAAQELNQRACAAYRHWASGKAPNQKGMQAYKDAQNKYNAHWKEPNV